MVNPLVSVVVLNWNGARYLPSCVESARHQTYQPIEIIVIDNGSTDDSVHLLRDNYPEIRLVVHHENLGFAQG